MGLEICKKCLHCEGTGRVPLYYEGEIEKHISCGYCREGLCPVEIENLTVKETRKLISRLNDHLISQCVKELEA